MLAKLKVILSSVWSDICDTYKRSKLFLLAIAAVIITLEFRKLKEFMIAYQGKQEIQKDQKEDQALVTKENDDNQQADALANKAKNEPNPGDDWYKSK
jgi:hypothetical protein